MAGEDYFDSSVEFTKVDGQANSGSSEVDVVFDAIEVGFNLLAGESVVADYKTHNLVPSVPAGESLRVLTSNVTNRAGMAIGFDSDGDAELFNPVTENEDRFAYTGFFIATYADLTIDGASVVADPTALDHDGFSADIVSGPDAFDVAGAGDDCWVLIIMGTILGDGVAGAFSLDIGEGSIAIDTTATITSNYLRGITQMNANKLTLTGVRSAGSGEVTISNLRIVGMQVQSG